MSEISTASGFSLNPLLSHEFKQRYEKHVQTIVCIANKKPNIREISTEQEKISNILKRSKEAARDFKQSQFKLKLQQENKRLKNSISLINSREKVKTLIHSREKVKTLIHSREKVKTQESEKLSAKTHKCKEVNLKQHEIERENLMLAHNLLKHCCDAGKYKKKMEREIGEYLRIKSNMQRLKPINDKKDRKFAHCEWNQLNYKPRLKTEAKTPGESSLQKRRGTETLGKVE